MIQLECSCRKGEKKSKHMAQNTRWLTTKMMNDLKNVSQDEFPAATSQEETYSIDTDEKEPLYEQEYVLLV